MIRYLEASIENMRDIGGYDIGKQKILYGKLIRSNLPNRLSDQDIEYIKQLGVSSVIDLRTQEEYLQKPSVFEKSSYFKFYHCPLIVGRDIPASPDDVPLSYLEILEDKDNILKILNIVATDDNGVLYFCNAGKDRTGVITALIMMILGASKSDIINDYLLTKGYMHDILQRFIEQSNRDISEIITPKAEYMEKFLSGFIDRYGDISSYLKYIGFSKIANDRLKNKLLTEL